MCVLLVEDDQAVAVVVAEALQDEGFRLVSASDGESGLAQFEAEPDRFSILITNVQLPGKLQGGDVAASVRALRPEIPVVIATGAPEIVDEQWHSRDGYIVLTKPYRLRQLSETVHSLTREVRGASDKA